MISWRVIKWCSVKDYFGHIAVSQSGSTELRMFVENVVCLAHQTSCEFLLTPDFLWHRRAIWNAMLTSSNPWPCQTFVTSGLFCALWQHPRAHICQNVRRLRGSQCIHFISPTQAGYYYLAVYKCCFFDCNNPFFQKAAGAAGTLHGQIAWQRT